MVSTWQQTNSSTQTVLAYPVSIDGDFAVAARVADAFAPHAQATPNMTVALDPGFIFDPRNANLSTIAAQASGAVSAPVSQPRIDRVVIDAGTGILSVVTGTEAASPSAPALPQGTLPVAQILLQTSSTAITNDMIMDERAVWGPAVVGVPWAIAVGTADAITASYTPANASLYDGLLLSFRASAANATTTPTFAPDGLTAHTITKKGGEALVAGDIANPLAECLVRYNAANAVWELLDPQSEFTLPVIANNDVLANTSGAAAEPVGTSLSALIDSAIGSTRGALLERGAAGWTLLAPGTSGNALLSNGAGADPSYGAVAASAINIGAGLANDGAGNLKALSALSMVNAPTTTVHTLTAADAGTVFSSASAGGVFTLTLSMAMAPGSRIACIVETNAFNIAIPAGIALSGFGGSFTNRTISLATSNNESIILSYDASGSFLIESVSPSSAQSLGLVPTLTQLGAQLNALTNGGGQGSWNPATVGQLLAAVAGVYKINIQVKTASGTYTPTTGLVSVFAVLKGGGGGGGGGNNGNTPTPGSGGGGASGVTAVALLNATQIGASQSVTIGAGGTAGTPTINGGMGGITSLGTLLSAGGGSGGESGVAGVGVPGTPSNTSTGALFTIPGAIGLGGNADTGGAGGNGGGSGAGVGGFANENGGNAIGNWGGGGGGACDDLNVARIGGTGAAGMAIFIEFVAV